MPEMNEFEDLVSGVPFQEDEEKEDEATPNEAPTETPTEEVDPSPNTEVEDAPKEGDVDSPQELEEDTPEEEGDEITSLKAQLELLKRKVASLTKEGGDDAPATQDMPTSIEDEAFVEDLDKAFGDETIANATLNKVYKAAIAKAKELVLNDLPGRMQKQVQYAVTNQTLGMRFAEAYPEYAKERDMVAMIAEDMIGQDPSMQADTDGLHRFWAALPGAMEKALGKKGNASKGESKTAKPKPQAIPGSRGVRAKPTNELANEFAELVNGIEPL